MQLPTITYRHETTHYAFEPAAQPVMTDHEGVPWLVSGFVVETTTCLDPKSPEYHLKPTATVRVLGVIADEPDTPTTSPVYGLDEDVFLVIHEQSHKKAIVAHS